MAFANQKNQRMERDDLSKKGSVDEAIVDLVGFINSLPQYFTTSSCSGRILIFENVSLSQTVEKKGCKWLYVSHSLVAPENVLQNLNAISDEAVFKFEPFIMHVQCQTLEDAQKLHQAAVTSGFRNSGITVGSKGKIMMAVRSTHSLEAPLSSKGNLLVSQEYIKYLTESANRKMEENTNRINRSPIPNLNSDWEEKEVVFFDSVKSFSNHELNKTKKVKTKCQQRKKKETYCEAVEAEDDQDDFPLFVFEGT